MNNTEPSIPKALKHTCDLLIATANSRQAARWATRTWSLPDFVARLATTTRTPETVESYAATPRALKDDIKDVGAFVGGPLKGGSRKADAVANRQILTFDADHGKAGITDRIAEALSGVCYTLYSTHSHTPSHPRLRLIVYPARALSVEEYQAVSRKIAADIDIEAFDEVSYRVNQLMYWPSTSIDGDYLFVHNDAPLLDVDATLASYPGPWEDSTLWPTSSRETKHISRLLKKQADPLTKRGVVGSYCRAVSLADALAGPLADVYRLDAPGRYTYIDGSTTKGLVVYEDKWAYSNHASDPAFGQTCNAFDLVRIHKYGHLDASAPADASGTKLASYVAMREYALALESVKLDMVASGLTEAVPADFDAFDAQGNEPEDAPEALTAWHKDLQMSADGTKIQTSFLNACLIISNDPKLSGSMRYNEFSCQLETAVTGEAWTDARTHDVRVYIGRRYNLDFPEAKVVDAISWHAHRCAYHPVRDYLNALEWDGQERIETLYIDYLGAEDNFYTREAALCWFTAAVGRIYQPGLKFDYAVVLSGPQGIRKSTFISTLGLGKWYGELTSFDAKIAIEETNGTWILEIGEMGATNRHELEQQKAFLSATSTRVRLSYERYAQDFKRQCVFMGSTNLGEYLKDSTGNRRWWPISCTELQIDTDKLTREIDQIWAEARVLWMNDHPLTLSDEATEIAVKTQETAREDDEWQGIIEAWLEEPCHQDRYDTVGGFTGEGALVVRDRVCVAEILADCFTIKGPVKQADRRRIAGIMDRIKGWERTSTSRFGTRFGHQRGWVLNTKF